MFSEKDEILKEIIPFLEDLLPGVPASAVVSALISVCFFLVLILLAVVAFLILSYVLKKNSAKKYLRNLILIRDLEKISMDESEKKIVKNLLTECVFLGSIIDAHTNRRNNSKKISAISYRIFCALKIDPLDAILFAAAALVYDVGFLDIRAAYFHLEILSRREKESLKSHVERNLYYLDFVPEKYLEKFLGALLYHHENQDGSGYPEGISAEGIPVSARVIHAVETYVALVSRRNYRKPLSKKNALKKIHDEIFLYDAEIVSLLEKVLNGI